MLNENRQTLLRCRPAADFAAGALRLQAESKPAAVVCATEDLQVPIYRPQAWRTLTLNGTEQVLVYFDESNRADYLSEGIDTEEYGYVTRFGLRVVLVYPGQDEGVISALQAIPTDD